MKELLGFFKTPVWLGATIMALGLLIRFYVGRQRFKRRTITGVQLFSTYTRFIIVTTLESITGFIGRLLFWSGVILILFTWFIY